jgi:excisionase family DNA binding protein
MSFRSASASGFGNANSERGNAPSIADRIECIPHALTARELKAILQVSDQTIYRMIADQTIPFLTVRNSYRFDPKQIAEWLRERSMSA